MKHENFDSEMNGVKDYTKHGKLLKLPIDNDNIYKFTILTQFACGPNSRPQKHIHSKNRKKKKS